MEGFFNEFGLGFYNAPKIIQSGTVIINTMYLHA